MTRFKSVEDIIMDITERQKRKRDEEVAVGNLGWSEEHDTLMVGTERCRITRGAEKTLLGELLKPIKKGMEKREKESYPQLDSVWRTVLTPHTRSEVFQRLVDGRESKALIRFDDQDGFDPLVYAVRSLRYKRMDHDVMIQILEQMDSTFTGGISVVESNYDYDYGHFRVAPTSLTKGDHVPVVNFINGESGLCSLRINAGIFTVLCSNGLMRPFMGQTVSGRYIHLGNENEIALPDFGAVVNEGIRIIGQMDIAESIYLNSSQKETLLVQMGEALWQQKLADRVAEMANRKYHGGATLAHVIHAITDAAHEVPSNDLRHRMEEYASNLLENGIAA